MNIQPKYLGDAVYASFDGYNILLHIGSHEEPACVALEPPVLEALSEYAAAIRSAIRQEIRDEQDRLNEENRP